MKNGNINKNINFKAKCSYTMVINLIINYMYPIRKDSNQLIKYNIEMINHIYYRDLLLIINA